MKNIKRTILIGFILGAIFFGWILHGFYTQNWNFNPFSFKDWSFIWNEFISGWIISATSDWIFILSIIFSIPVFIVLWRLSLHISWSKIPAFLTQNFRKFVLYRTPEKVVKKKIKIKAKQSHKKTRPKPINTTGRPLPKMAGKTMDAEMDESLEGSLTKTLSKSAGNPQARPAFMDEDIEDIEKISLDDIQMPQRVSLDEDMTELLKKANYQIIKDVDLGKIHLSHVAISAEKILLCYEDNEKGDWLADEEFFNEEAPFWFSETSDRVSPIYQLLTETKAFTQKVKAGKYAQQVIPILIEKEGTIINAEDMDDTWKKLGIIVCRTGMGGPDELPSFEESIPKTSDKGTIRDLESIQGLF